MKFYLATTGSHGDVYPFLAIGRELLGRGHEVLLLAQPRYSDDARRAGMPLHPLNGGIDQEELEAVLANVRGPLSGGRALDAVGALYDEAEKDIWALRALLGAKPPDALVSHHLVLSARWLAEELRIPHANVVLAPVMWRDRRDCVGTFQRWPGARQRRLAAGVERVLWPLFSGIGDAQLNALRKRTELPRERRGLDGSLRGGDVNLALWSQALRPPLDGDPPNGRICGFPWYEGAHEAGLDERVARFLDAGSAPIVFTLGTSAVRAPGDFFRMAVEACGALGRRGVLLIGRGAAAPRDLPAAMLAHGYAPFSQLLPRAAAVVQHGGIGSVAQALRAGRPTVQCPAAYDQYNNALRVVELGTGVMVDRRRMRTHDLVAALRHVLGEPSIERRARAVAGQVAREDGARCAADHVERLATELGEG